MSALVISLDFELFWGVTDSRTIDRYGNNIEGVWVALPKILALFKKYGIQATWATVGMLMCEDYKQWMAIRPAVMPTYDRETCSTYAFADAARQYPKLFFAPTLVKQILATQGQELASHTYSHFYSSEKSSTPEQFAADLDCVKTIFDEYAVKPTSLVFPRNQNNPKFLGIVQDKGFTAYRGNQAHQLYREGHQVSSRYFWVSRLIKAADAYLPLTGQHIYAPPENISAKALLNIPASQFLRPVTKAGWLNSAQLNRIKGGMLAAAKNNKIFHLWWHPHNFGVNTEANLANLEVILKYYVSLNSEYGMRSLSMQALDRS